MALHGHGSRHKGKTGHNKPAKKRIPKKGKKNAKKT